MNGIQTVETSKRGGKRDGAGRKGLLHSVLSDPRFAKARGINPLYASEILAHVIDERRAWQRVFSSEDDRVVLQALQFLVSMRDGKPAQQINVTSTSLQLNASDLERARAIVAEIRGESSQPRLGLGTGETQPIVDAQAEPQDVVAGHNASGG